MKVRTIDLNFLGNKKSIAAYLIETEEGLAIVECGPHSTWAALEAGLAKYGYTPKDVKHLFLSHIHFDHAGAAWAFAEGGTKVYVHPIGAPHMAQPERLYNSARMIYGDKMDFLWGAMEPIDENLLVVPSDFEKINVLGLEWTAHFTPGHAKHHIAWEVKKARSRAKSIVFAGDVAGVRIKKGAIVPPCPPPDIQIEDWKISIERLRSLDAKAIYLTHYGKITDIADHLTQLETVLDAWKAWMKPYFEAQTPPEEIVPKFTAYVHQSLKAAGISDIDLKKYDGANPPYMSVVGLLRYWKKATR